MQVSTGTSRTNILSNMIAPKILNIKNIKLYVQNELKFKYKTPSQEHHT